jgi:hypothetical protein
MIGILDRPLFEASVIAIYLMTNGPDAVGDYRKCSNKDRLRILREMESGSPFFDTKAGKRLRAAIREKMDFEGVTKDDFADQKKNGSFRAEVSERYSLRSNTTISIPRPTA